MKNISKKEYEIFFNRLMQFEKYQAKAKERGGELLSKEFLGIHVHLNWKCSKGHEWKAMPSNIGAGHWCPRCVRSAPSIQRCEKAAKEKLGKCLSKNIKKSTDKMYWQCKKGHKWKSRFGSVVYGNSWCLACYIENLEQKEKRK